jgi:two-component system, response regulator RegA
VTASDDATSILIVDDDMTYRTALGRAFERRGFRLYEADSVPAALLLLDQVRVSYASVDLRMPGGSGLELVRRLKLLEPSPVVVVLTGYGSIATAVEAIKLGAANYLTKPADAVDLLRAFGIGLASPEPAAREVDARLAEVPSLARVEWEHLNRVVAECAGNISQAARVLRMQRRSLQRKLAKYPVSK